MYSVAPRDIERFALRLLLLKIRGATSFVDLKTYNGVVYETFKQAAMARNLLLNENEFEHCMTEAARLQMPYQLRQTFAQICSFCSPLNAGAMWIMFAHDLSEDYQRLYPIEEAKNRVLFIQDTFINIKLYCLIERLNNFRPYMPSKKC